MIPVYERVYLASVDALLATGKDVLTYRLPANAKLALWGSEMISETIVDWIVDTALVGEEY